MILLILKSSFKILKNTGKISHQFPQLFKTMSIYGITVLVIFFMFELLQKTNIYMDIFLFMN